MKSSSLFVLLCLCGVVSVLATGTCGTEALTGYFVQDSGEYYDDDDGDLGLLMDSWASLEQNVTDLNNQADNEIVEKFKVVYFIRHGHSIANGADPSDLDSEDYFDAALSGQGVGDCLELQEDIDEAVDDGLWIQVGFTSPLSRALNSTNIMFNNVDRDDLTFFASEGCREKVGVLPRDRRHTVSDIEGSYPDINFDLMNIDSDYLWEEDQRESVERLNERAQNFLDMLWLRPENNIAVISHESFISEIFEITGHAEYEIGYGEIVPIVLRFYNDDYVNSEHETRHKYGSDASGSGMQDYSGSGVYSYSEEGSLSESDAGNQASAMLDSDEGDDTEETLLETPTLSQRRRQRLAQAREFFEASPSPFKRLFSAVQKLRRAAKTALNPQ